MALLLPPLQFAVPFADSVFQCPTFACPDCPDDPDCPDCQNFPDCCACLDSWECFGFDSLLESVYPAVGSAAIVL